MKSPAASPSMIGREADLETLREQLAESSEGHPRAVVVGGEAGIGKTRLLDEFRAEASRSALVLTGRSVDLGADGAPYAPFTAILRQLADDIGIDALLEAAGTSRSVLTVLLPELGAIEGLGPPAIAERAGVERLYELVAVLLENVSRARQLVIVIEDIHWADMATLDLVRFLIRMLTGGRILIMLSYRSDEVLRGHPLRSYLPELDRTRRVVRWELARLDRAQVAAQCEQILGCPADAATVDRVYQLSEGVPFFVEELIGIDHLGTGDDLPETLRELLLARYERLSEPTQHVLRLMSAGGSCVDHELVAAVFTGTPEELDAAAREAVTANVLTTDGNEYSFRHALVREAIHTDLLPGERARFHTRYAEALESGRGGPRSPSEISYHWMAAHDVGRAFVATLEAMEEARLSYAYVAAATMGERAIELWDRVAGAEEIAGRSRIDLLAQTASALRNAGESDRALSMINVAIDESPREPGDRYARLLRDKAQYLANLSRPGSTQLLRQALELLPDSADSSLRAQLLGELAGRLMLEARDDEAVETATLAFEEASAGGVTERMSIAATVRGVARVGRGEIDAGLADLEKARMLAGVDGGPLLRYFVNASDVMNLLGRYDDAIAIAQTGAEQARERGMERTSGVMLSSNTVEPLLAAGRLDSAEALLDPALALDPPPGFRVHLQRMKLWLTLWRGDPARADELLRGWRAGMVAQSELEMQSRLGFARVAAEIAFAQGDLQRAWNDAGAITAPERRRMPAYDLPLLAIASRTLVALSKADSSIDTTDEETRLRKVMADVGDWPTAPVWRAVFDAELGGTDHDGTSVSGWQAASEAVVVETAPVHLRPYTRFRLAQALVVNGERAEAEMVARAARRGAERLGLGLITSWIDDFAAQAGLDLGAEAARHPRVDLDPSRLTEREQQVLALIEQGLSNRQIGERLYISAKTASVHVSSILRKVGASSRTEAVYRAAHTMH
ncbi:helix-turn-helix transcriptional regulator [Diaminobutyricibacter tongyongensis]|nr:helix-turn-helix transcriptional regulator [Diaminobutyricibacter tongyongensis]